MDPVGKCGVCDWPPSARRVLQSGRLTTCIRSAISILCEARGGHRESERGVEIEDQVRGRLVHVGLCILGAFQPLEMEDTFRRPSK